MSRIWIFAIKLYQSIELLYEKLECLIQEYQLEYQDSTGFLDTILLVYIVAEDKIFASILSDSDNSWFTWGRLFN